MKKNKTIGIDYSLSSPAICVCRGKFKFENCKIYFLTNVKKYEGKFYNGQIDGRLHLPYTSEQQRHDQISEWALSVIGTAIGNIFIEGYSFGSKGLVFNLAENMGTLKHKPTTCPFCGADTSIEEEDAIFEDEEEQDDWN